MSRVFVAKRPGSCAGCGTEVEGRRCRYRGRELYHENCVPSGDRAADREYYAGIQDAEQFQENRRMFGEAEAERMEIEHELRFGEW